MSHGRVIVFALASGLAAVVAGVCVVLLAPSQVAAFVLAVGAVIAIGIAAVWSEVRRYGDALTPLTLCAVFYVLTFAGGAIYFWFNPKLTTGAISSVLITRPDLIDGTAIGAVGFAALVAGYKLAPVGRLARRLPAIPRLRSAAFPVVVLATLEAIGWLSRLAQIATGRYFHTTATDTVTTGATWLIYATSFLPTLALAIVGAYSYLDGRHPSARRTTRRLFLALWLVDLAWYLPTGERGQLVGLGALLCVILYYSRRKMPWKLVTVGVLVLMFVVFPFGLAYRGQTNSYQLAPQQSLAQAADVTFGSGLSAMFSQGFTATFSRFNGVTSLGIVSETDRETFSRAPGETLLWGVEGFIPRAIVGDKIDPGLYANEFGRTHALIHSGDYVTAIAPTTVGEWYLNFGWLGVVPGMMLIGAAYRFFGEYVRDRRDSPGPLAVYALMAWPLISAHEAILAVGVVGATKLIIVFALLIGLAGRLAGVVDERKALQEPARGLAPTVLGREAR